MSFSSEFSPAAIAARDSVQSPPEGYYGKYSPTFPNPVYCFVEMFYAYKDTFYQNLVPHNGINQWLKDTWEWHYICSYITLKDIFYIILTAILFTILRFIVYKVLLERIPLWFKLAPEAVEKFPEAAFRTGVYAPLWLLSFYSIAQRNLFYYPFTVWEDWIAGAFVPFDIYVGYIIQMGFYIHMMYATTYIETVRKDYAVQMLHHGLTLCLLGYSLCMRFHYIGLLVLFIHDFADVFLEVAKAILYFKDRGGKSYKLPEHIANVLFAVFVLQWILFRLYWYPVKLLYATGFVSQKFYPEAPFYSLFNIMLLVLYGLHIYWFFFIIRLVVKVITGNELSDTRDLEEEKKND
ncbi:PREDICTED: ceramide synthase 1-like [Amphimedon queenslandica]|uniref:TLC domain-containing protein n=1 Tax=Amphimedon queenslandica TaxID=400682 RepID=A0A1X7VTW6_AMPQE|nr:PREDICTED: ceramide synthase 1-like [Amphimedon queenslandica]|eukprot:XP_003382832.1 PREDICTED: ceramide synthase 1-like [Amphimedon queenslandica]